MAYLFDHAGWYSGTAPSGTKRTTEVGPADTSLTTTPGEPRSNWTGYEWRVLPFVVVPQPPNTLPRTRMSVWERAKRERDRRYTSGMFVLTRWFQTDDAARLRVMLMVARGASLPANTRWRTIDGSFINMTPTRASNLLEAMLDYEQQVFERAESLRDEIAASAIPLTIDILAGWPVTFEG